METEYTTYEYEKYKLMEKELINFWKRKSDCLLTFELYRIM